MVAAGRGGRYDAVLMAHHILVPVDGDRQKLEEILDDLRWLCVERGWSPHRPQLVHGDDAVLSVTPWERIDDLESGVS